MPERWKAIPGHKGYQASSLGRVRSVPRTLRDGRKAGGVVLRQQPDKDGYLTVMLGRKRVRVNVVVQLAFAGPPEVRHRNGDRTDNRPSNLIYGSRVENEADKRKKGTEERDGRVVSRPFDIGTSSVTGVTDAS